ncbi:RagB/SusD family nutrient uptake outer membrane protein [Winogradskyella ouciana]|uniref:RagB/SusD family nutrient uptake outer membrane protein n=1 Tax=Winogradskyella ouciana TaxID=2608631 RepID=A0A7K1GI87_9FLAO|nr:RagB/SusD family nutrient uptake outer membrane protein [Winogradskyella ouciana]MTE28328.1 RagB/SusD family nutrient uptake outer membrane protein [Winogradskyella ouciana]
MKKNVIKLMMVSGLLLTFLGCSDDFVNENPESGFQNINQLGEAASNNPDIVTGFIEGVYSTMYTTGTGGTGGHDDFGHKAYDLFADFLSSDVALSVSTYGWYRASITEMQCTEDFTFLDNYQVWRHYYRMIRAANTVIETLGGDEADPENLDNRATLGQALAMRAHSYWYLTQYMQNDYNPSQEILPIYRTVTNVGVGKSTAAEVFALIESDLNRAIVLLDVYNRPTKTQVNKEVAQAMLAYAIASQRDVSRMGEVVALCDAVISGTGATVMTAAEVTGGFNNVATPGWIWGVDLNGDIGLRLVSWWGQMDAFSYSYAWAGDAKAIDQNLYDAIPADDARKAQFFPGSGYYNLMPLDKFYDASRIIGGPSGSVVADYVYMRIAEMHILKAEALAKMGQDGPARTALREVLDQRLPDTSYLNGLSGAALLAEIHLQTRIEFWGEGKTYLSIKRNQTSTGVRGSNHLSFVGESFMHNDERLTFEIPELEIQSNVFINEQN